MLLASISPRTKSSVAHGDAFEHAPVPDPVSVPPVAMKYAGLVLTDNPVNVIPFAPVRMAVPPVAEMVAPPGSEMAPDAAVVRYSTHQRLMATGAVVYRRRTSTSLRSPAYRASIHNSIHTSIRRSTMQTTDAGPRAATVCLLCARYFTGGY